MHLYPCKNAATSLNAIGGRKINAMNTSANTNQNHDTTTSTARAAGIGFQRGSMAVALLATAITATAIGFAATGHADSGQSPSQLQSLKPTPANTQRTDGPSSIANNGIRMHFMVNGSPIAVLDVYKAALEGKGWIVTVASSGGWGDAGGATYTGTRGDTYGVFTGGGAGSTTDVSACAWPSKPANTNCGGDNRR